MTRKGKQYDTLGLNRKRSGNPWIDINMVGVVNNDTKTRAITKGLEKAKARHGKNISYCGYAQSWADCLTWWRDASGRLNALFQYNVGEYTHAVKIRC